MAWINSIPKGLQLERKTRALRPNPWGILPLAHFNSISAQGLLQAWLVPQVMELQNPRSLRLEKSTKITEFNL